MNQLTRMETGGTSPIDLVNIGEARALAAQIDVRSPLTVACFGQDIGRHASEYADELLAQARNGDLDEMGKKLGEVVAAAQKFDLGAFDNKLSHLPIVGPLIAAISQAKTRALSQFSNLQEQVDRLIADIAVTQKRLASRALGLDAMYVGVDEEQRTLALHAKAAELRMAELDEELKVLDDPADPVASERRSAMEASRAALSKRVGDLSVLQHSAVQTLPMIRMVQANNMALIEKFQTIRNLTVPAWKRAFMMALALQEQKDAVALANTIDDATNYFMVRNSQLLNENAVATAKAGQRLVIDVATLRTVHQNVVKTLQDVRRANDEGITMRAKAMAELEVLRADMRATMAAPGEQPALRAA